MAARNGSPLKGAATAEYGAEKEAPRIRTSFGAEKGLAHRATRLGKELPFSAIWRPETAFAAAASASAEHACTLKSRACNMSLELTLCELASALENGGFGNAIFVRDSRGVAQLNSLLPSHEERPRATLYIQFEIW